MERSSALMAEILLAIALVLPWPSVDRAERAQRFAPLILEASERYQVDALLVVALIARESSFRQRIRGKSDRADVGLMGLRLGDDCVDGETDPAVVLAPRFNIMRGVRCLARHVKRCGSVLRALNRYNGRRCSPKSWPHSRRILANYQRIRELVEKRVVIREPL